MDNTPLTNVTNYKKGKTKTSEKIGNFLTALFVLLMCTPVILVFIIFVVYFVVNLF